MPVTQSPLLDALHAQLAARVEATLALMLILGDDYEEDITEVVTWVFDPHVPDPMTVEEIDRDTRALHAFTSALYGGMTWDAPGGGW